MRLIHSSTLALRDFPPDRIPPYAILSHWWGEDEVLFADMEKGTAKGKKEGYRKIQFACRQAALEGIEYVWVDTCCIDKSSSAELSESINSMYLWYKRSSICYAYLADVPSDVGAEAWESAFAASKWFTRGWTLQELIAPSDLHFFSNEWIDIGTKKTRQTIIADITGIDVEILSGRRGPEYASVAKRMSWASDRSTTRVEDVAYSLMGLFDVNMPMLYGEGAKAFLRLQEEIMKQSDDQSLFAWIDPDAPEDSYHGLLAQSPGNFRDSADIVPYRSLDFGNSFSMSNKGLRIELPLESRAEDLYMGALECSVPPDYKRFLGIYLNRMPYMPHRENQYVRVRAQKHHQVSLNVRPEPKPIYVRQHQLNPEYLESYPSRVIQLRRCRLQGAHYKLIGVYSASDTFHHPAPFSKRHDWIPPGMLYMFGIEKANDRLAAALLFDCWWAKRFVVLLGSTTGFGVGFNAALLQNLESVEDLHKAYKPNRLDPKSDDPRVMSNSTNVGDRWIGVVVETLIVSQTKYYMVDLIIK